MKFLKVLLFLGFCLIFLSISFCFALEEATERTFHLDGPAKLSISTVMGNIEISTHEKNTVQMTATKKLVGLPTDEAQKIINAIKIKTEQVGNQIFIKSEYSPMGFTKFWFDLKQLLTSGKTSNLEVKYYLLVPEGIEINFSTVSGEVNIQKVQGRCKGKTVSGSVIAKGVGKELSISTVSGKINITGQGRLFLKSVSGDVWVDIQKSEQAQDLTVSTVSGEVTIILPENASVNLSVKTISGKFSSEFPILLEGDNRISNKRFEGKIAGSTQQSISCKIETVSGNISLCKKEEVIYL
ncbi:MAG: DUF4097 family beta strand repeat protein [Candidatus Atribacteria bacterium]|nr:DUF4097 family beta strand repeat protein [Candidatus Atribacteria bacterium]MCD6349477.1 DUF4097 family beta strand repeat protein [Candidatus Atribacteria bacterium]